MNSNYIKITQNKHSHLKALTSSPIFHPHQSNITKNHPSSTFNSQKPHPLDIFQKSPNTTLTLNSKLKKQFLTISKLNCQPTTPEASISDTTKSDTTDIYPKNKLELESIWDAIIIFANNGGVVIKNKNNIKGFVPTSKLDPSRIPRGLTGKQKGILQGKKIRAKVIQVDQDKCVLSEKDLRIEEQLQKMSVGDIVKGKVDAIEDYGAFVHIEGEDGVYRGLTGLIHKSELSWEPVAKPESIINIELSLRKTKLDPLEESIEVLLPPGDVMNQKASTQNETTDNIQLKAINSLRNKLLEQEGIEAVNVGRKAEEQHKVSQDLELWLSKEVLEDGYAVVARSGKVLQEFVLKTTLSKEEIKNLLTIVLRKLD